MFKDRKEAGKRLAAKLLSNSAIKRLRNQIIVLAIPRGGVVVGKEIAQALGAPLDVLITRKIGAPGNPELAIGAVGPGKIRIVDWEMARRVGADKDYIEEETKKKTEEIKNREQRFRKEKPAFGAKNKIVVLTDDGIATGATVEVAIACIRTQKPKKLILAVPVAPPEVAGKLKPLVDELICLDQPEFFAAVGQFYQEFEQISDDEVVQLLASRD